jgi:GH25 family lysozyme M1 (1,4-beta-N-acetylmuramidase)
MISNCGHDERWNYRGGNAGDNNGTEWQLVNWYSYPWNVALRYPDAVVRHWMGDQARAAANNNHIGYDQGQRLGFWDQLQKAGYDAAKISVNCETDCSAGVLAIAKAAGYHFGIQKLKDINQTGYTGNEEAILKNAGFEVLRDSKYLTSDKYLDNGDILLNTQNHTAFNVTRGAACDAGTSAPKKVIDVSYAQGRIDWDKVKGQIDGAILRCGYGDDTQDQDDNQWLRNVAECARLGIPYGVYLYSYAGNTSQVQSEINHALRLITGKEPVLGVFLDLEENSLGYLAKTAAEMWCTQMNAKGYKAGIYCGAYYYKSYLQGMYEKLRALWWIAGYGNNSGVPEPGYKPNPGFKYDAWQYTSKARIAGINTYVDASEWYAPFDGEPDPKPKPEPDPVSTTPHITYEIRDKKGSLVYGKDGSIAKLPDAMTAIRIGVDIGRVEYRAHCAGRWLQKVTGNNWSDFQNGYAGDDQNAIDALQIYYYTDVSKTDYYEAVYAVKPFGMYMLKEVHDTDWQDYDGDNTAGIFWSKIEGVKIALAKC